MGGDWNDYIDSTNSSVLRLCTSLNLVDPWIHHYPHLPTFPTHKRGSHRIDAVFVSQDILSTVQGIGYSPAGLLTNSNHRALFIKFSRDTLFGSTTARQDIIGPTRNFRSSDRQAVTVFTEAMYNHLLQNNAFERSQLLDDTTDVTNDPHCHLVESLDILIGQAGEHGENKCRRRRPEWYSVPLVRQRLTVSYLRHYLYGLKWGKNREEVILHKLRHLASDIKHLPKSINEVTSLLQLIKGRYKPWPRRVIRNGSLIKRKSRQPHGEQYPH